MFIPAQVEIVYGELSLVFEDEKELNDFLSDTGIIIGETKPESYVIGVNRNWCGKSSPFCQLFLVLQVVMPILNIDIFYPFYPC